MMSSASPQLPKSAESIRSRRVAGEWNLLLRLCDHNPDILRVLACKQHCGADRFEIAFSSSALSFEATCPLSAFEAEIVFPDFFPAVPIQAFVRPLLLHPNIHPETGFVCLWSQMCSTDTIVDALLRLQGMAGWTLYNEDAEHLMQADAFERRGTREPLPFEPIQLPTDVKATRAYRMPPSQFRRRLSP